MALPEALSKQLPSCSSDGSLPPNILFVLDPHDVLARHDHQPDISAAVLGLRSGRRSDPEGGFWRWPVLVCEGQDDVAVLHRLSMSYAPPARRERLPCPYTSSGLQSTVSPLR